MEAVAPSTELTPVQPLNLSPATVPSRSLPPASAEGEPARELTMRPPAASSSPASSKFSFAAFFVHYGLLLAITALGGVLRFVCLDRPPIWGDEAATFGRASGTFFELMGRLQSAGFAPVHYELVWWIGQHVLLTPFMMRLVPAIAGTAMIPAMYWLATQLIGRRAALLTALLTATNAFLLNYSRDAKMYSPFWLFVVLNVASLIWWLRVRTPLSWCAWVASGAAMVGFDALGWITVAVELLIVLSARPSNWLSLPRLILLSVCSSAIWCLTLGVLVGVVLIAAHGLHDAFKLLAIVAIALAVIRIVMLLLGSWLRSKRPDAIITRVFRWPTERSIVRPWIVARIAGFRWPPLILFIFGVLIMLAGPVGYYYDFNRFLEKVDENGWHGTGIDWVEGYDAGRDGPSLVGFTASAFLTSWEWPRTVDERAILPRTLRLLTAGTLSLAALLALGLLPWPWARPLRPNPGIGGWRSALWLTLWLTVPPYAFYCVSVKGYVGPFDWLEIPKDAHLNLLQRISISLSGNASTIAHNTFLAWPHLSILVGLLALIWFWIAGSGWRERFLRVCQSFGIVFVTLLLIEAFYLIYPKIDAAMAAHSDAWQQHGSVWMPRYIAVVLPAFLILVTVLLYRLPTRPLRWAAALLFVIVNVGIDGARVFAGTEQPTPLLARDILASQAADRSDRSVIAFFQPALQFSGAAPGTLGLYNAATRYYITILSPRSQPINEVLADQMHYRVHPGRGMWMSYTGFVINEVRRLPQLKTFITWERLEPREIDLTDKPLDALAPVWRLASEQSFMVRDHWRWMDTCVLRRRCYVRTPSGQ